MKRNFRPILFLVLVFMLFSNMFVFADTGGSLNGVTTTVTTPAPVVTQPSGSSLTGSQPNNYNTAEDLNAGLGVDEESMKKASKYTWPVKKLANFGYAFIVSLAFACLFFITALDLLYIAVPWVRTVLYPHGSQNGEMQQHGGGMGGMGGGYGGYGGGGYGGYGGGGYGGYGGGGYGGGASAQKPAGAVSSFISHWISDEAVQAVQSADSKTQQSTGGGGYGGFGGGMGGYGGNAQVADAPMTTKMIILEYAKKRVIFLVVFGICAVVFGTTVCTDIGTKIGVFFVHLLYNMKNNIPQ